MKQYKWFWITFCFWCLMGAVGSWALIFSPLHSNSRMISEFLTTINGQEEKNQVLVSTAPIGSATESLTREWESQGWKPLTKNFNLASALLDLPRAYDKYFSSLAQLHVFKDQNTGAFRILGLVQNASDHQTYQWIADIPQKALRSNGDRPIDFPFKAPNHSKNLTTIKAEKVDVLTWESSPDRSPEESFNIQCASQGFDKKIWAQNENETVFVLQKGSTKLLAVVEHGADRNRVSLVKLD